MSVDLSKWREEIRALEKGGEHLLAYDLARQALDAKIDDPQLKYLAVRNLVRCGAVLHARRLYRESGLREMRNLDYRMMEARIEKDIGLGLADAARRERLTKAARICVGAFEDFAADPPPNVDLSYPTVNAATLYALAGDEERAAQFARLTLELCRKAGKRDYYGHASEAEALVVLGEQDKARDALAEAVKLDDGDLAARASTRRQLRLLLQAKNLPSDILDPLKPPEVLHYVGHMFAPSGARVGLAADREPDIAARIAAALDRRRWAAAFGSLASGSDILFAEACLSRGIDLYVVLPFAQEEFKAVSVAPAGEAWLRRFDACLARARRVTYTNEGEYLGDDSLFEYGGRTAMGMAVLRSRRIESSAVQIAVWDGKPGGGAGGTASNVALWRRMGREGHVIPVERRAPPAGAAPPAAFGGSRRELRSILFGDTVGFSKAVPDRLLPKYHEVFLGRIGDSLAERGDAVLFCNSWGDAVHMVMRDPCDAARWALEVQDRLRRVRYTELGFAGELRLRLSIHFGPVFQGVDRLTRTKTYFGNELTRTARIEPVTPAGEVYATEATAAELALADAPDLVAEYVGQTSLHKSYGNARLYSLRRRQIEEPPAG